MKNHIKNDYDAVIVGAGPGGTSASLYLKRAGLKILVIEKQAIGGKVNFTEKVENYLLGRSVTGLELGEMFKNQIDELNIDCKMSTVTNIAKENNSFNIHLKNGSIVTASAVIVATGTKERLLEVENSNKYQYRGITYCAICDGPSFSGGTMVVIGGGDAAIEEGLFLSKLAKKLYLVHRRQGFRASPNLVNHLREQENVEFLLDSVVDRVDGEQKISSVWIKNTITSKITKLDVDVVFPYIGQIPTSDFLKDLNVLNNEGFVITDGEFKTSIDGLYAIGDVIEKKVRQIATAVSDGCISAINVIKYIQNQ